MATIQVRHVPDDVYTTLRRRAGSAGMSLQEYLLHQLCQAARRRTPAEVIAEVEEHIRVDGIVGFARVTSSDDVRADRRSH